ncbi:MAG: NPCBM/NEW2 domain-containing protein [Anaerohalosphaera sp.]|nr:NPCBM/NEW2 domain-containing protein [Anaerohalosphaera sp.]
MNEKMDFIALNRLILASIDGTISSEDFSRLDKMIASNPAIADHYAEFMSIYVALREPGEVATSFTSMSNQVEMNGELDLDLWRALAASEKTAITVEVERAKEPELQLVGNRRSVERQRVISKLSLAMAILSSAALIFLLVLIWLVPVKGPVIATLTDSMDAMWEGSDEIANETELRAGRMKLIRGFAEIEMYDGAVVTLQAPTEIELEGPNRLMLLVGKISAFVPEIAVGFVVRTHGVSIVDYGTEFGVTADSRGNVEAHVFKGEVEMRLGNDPLVFDVSERVTQGQAKQKAVGGNIIQPAPFANSKFIRKISSQDNFTWNGQDVKLADIIGGGNGFGTGKANWGIDIQTGRQIKIDSTNFGFSGSGRYNFASNPFVDGVFIPDGGNGPVRISSTGLYFTQCPDTNGTAVGNFLNGAWHNHIEDKPSHMLRLGGRTFEKAGQAFFMHANKGITFDLDAIRNNIHGVHINSFKALAGVSDTVLEIWPESSRTDFWVLVDGQLKLEQIDVKPDDISFIIDIPLTDQDRFLTIITTDSGDEYGTSRDWAMFAEPVLELELE